MALCAELNRLKLQGRRGCSHTTVALYIYIYMYLILLLINIYIYRVIYIYKCKYLSYICVCIHIYIYVDSIVNEGHLHSFPFRQQKISELFFFGSAGPLRCRIFLLPDHLGTALPGLGTLLEQHLRAAHVEQLLLWPGRLANHSNSPL